MELVNAFKKGDWLTRSSAIVMGLGNILRKQFIKGILFLFTEAAFLFFMAAYGWQCLLALPDLGEKEQGEVWNETLGVYEYVQGDNSRQFYFMALQFYLFVPHLSVCGQVQ